MTSYRRLVACALLLALTGCAATPPPSAVTPSAESTPDRAELVTLTIGVGDWMGISADLDNLIDVQIVDGDPELVELATRIREEGRGQIIDWPANPEALAAAEPVDMVFSRSDWEWLIGMLDDSARVYRDLADGYTPTPDLYDFDDFGFYADEIEATANVIRAGLASG